MITKVNTDKMEEISKDINSAINDLEDEINALFNRFANVPTGTKEWIGNQANYYFSRIALDKKQYLMLIGRLKSIAKEIGSEASSIQTSIKSNNTTN